MRTFLTLWLGASVGLLGVLALRDLWLCWRLGRENDRRLAEWRARQVAEMRARNQRFLDDLAVFHAMGVIEENTVFQTEFGSRKGITVYVGSPDEACEALVAKYLQPVKVA